MPQIPGSASIIIMGLAISMGGASMSYNSVCLSSLANLLQLKNSLSHQQLIFQLSIATSSFNVGLIISPFFYRKYLSIFGELNGLTAIDVLGTLLMVIQLTQLTFYVLLVCRFLLGIVLGLSTSIISVYLNSIAPREMYAKIGCYMQVWQTIGISLAYSVSYLLDEHDQGDQVRWRAYLGFPCLALIVRSLVLRSFYPYDSIEYMVRKHKGDRLKTYCQLVYHRQDPQIVDEVISAKSISVLSHSHASTWRRRFTVAILVIASNQFSGINAILYYAKQLFNKITNNHQSDTHIIMVLLSLMQIASTLVGSEVAQMQGRRRLLLGGQFAIIWLLLGIVISDKLVSPAFEAVGQFAVILLIFLHVLVMNFTLGNLGLVYCTEIVEDITWIVLTLKVCSFTVALTTDYMIEYLGIGYMFSIFLILSMLAFLYLRGALLETKGLGLAEVYALFADQSLNGGDDEQLIKHNEQSIKHDTEKSVS